MLLENPFRIFPLKISTHSGIRPPTVHHGPTRLGNRVAYRWAPRGQQSVDTTPCKRANGWTGFADRISLRDDDGYGCSQSEARDQHWILISDSCHLQHWSDSFHLCMSCSRTYFGLFFFCGERRLLSTLDLDDGEHYAIYSRRSIWRRCGFEASGGAGLRLR